MIKLKNIIKEQKPFFQDTPNEFAYTDFKKWAYKNRKSIKDILLKALKDNRGDSTYLFLALAQVWLSWARKKAKQWSNIPTGKTPASKDFGRALAVMMKKDNLIIKKSGNKLTTIKEQLALAGGIINGAPDTDDVEKIKNTLTTDRDYVYNKVREQNTAKINQQLVQSKNLPIVDRIKMVNQIRAMLGETSLTEHTCDCAKEHTGISHSDWNNQQMESIQGYHTLMEEDDGVGEINGHSISLEIEETPEGLQRGLMHRKEFPSGKGMLLNFGEKSPTNIWMKNVNFPLDIIYLQDNKVVDMFKNAKPDLGNGIFDYLEGVICDMVLELPAGDADKYGIGLGDMFGFNDIRGTTEN